MKTNLTRSRKVWLSRTLGALALFGILVPIVYAAENSPEVDPKMRKELDTAEKRFGEAIQKRDTAALAEMLADYYADSIDDAKSAVTKPGTLARAKAGTLAFYRIEREMRLRVSAETYDLEGEAKAPSSVASDEPPAAKWVHVRRVWIKKEGRWLLIMQNIREVDEEKNEPKEK
jgi:hypothetical protein